MTITKEEYLRQLNEYIVAEMAKTPHDHESLDFWVRFNKDRQVEFDAQLVANGITVVG